MAYRNHRPVHFTPLPAMAIPLHRPAGETDLGNRGGDHLRWYFFLDHNRSRNRAFWSAVCATGHAVWANMGARQTKTATCAGFFSGGLWIGYAPICRLGDLLGWFSPIQRSGYHPVRTIVAGIICVLARISKLLYTDVSEFFPTILTNRILIR